MSGVDESLIKMSLGMTPEQRLRQNDRMLKMAHALRDSIKRSTHEHA
jgi:hypothetical protein